MAKFVTSKVGNTIIGIVLAVLIFVALNVFVGLGGAIGGAIAGGVGFGVAGVLGSVFKKNEPECLDETGQAESEAE